LILVDNVQAVLLNRSSDNALNT